MNNKTIAIIGVSRNPQKFSHKAVKAFQMFDYKVYPINPYADVIAGLKVYNNLAELPEKVSEVSIYLTPEKTLDLLEEFKDYSLEKIYLNPGSADEAVRDKARLLGLPVVEVCSIRAQGIDPGDIH